MNPVLWNRCQQGLVNLTMHCTYLPLLCPTSQRVGLGCQAVLIEGSMIFLIILWAVFLAQQLPTYPAILLWSNSMTAKGNVKEGLAKTSDTSKFFPWPCVFKQLWELVLFNDLSTWAWNGIDRIKQATILNAKLINNDAEEVRKEGSFMRITELIKFFQLSKNSPILFSMFLLSNREVDHVRTMNFGWRTVGGRWARHIAERPFVRGVHEVDIRADDGKIVPVCTRRNRLGWTVEEWIRRWLRSKDMVLSMSHSVCETSCDTPKTRRIRFGWFAETSGDCM